MASNAPDGGSEAQFRETRRPGRTRLIIALTLFAFLGGLAAMAWMMMHWKGDLRFGPPADPATLAGGPAAAGNQSDAGGMQQDLPRSGVATRAPSLVMSADQPEARVADLEQRMTRLAMAAEAASGYANRAEAMMVAFAVRRSLDAGAPLGHVETPLRLLFGEAQPKAVATIINAASEPVTLSTLRAGLEAVAGAVSRGSPGESWWAGAMRELRALAVIRRGDAPSPAPYQRLARARLNVESGQIEAAIAEIGALPPQPETTLWLEKARRYNEAHRALDVIEAAAILEPRAAPVVVPAALPAPAGR
jgi:hypothetical protein